MGSRKNGTPCAIYVQGTLSSNGMGPSPMKKRLALSGLDKVNSSTSGKMNDRFL
ncbi:Hypothetical protein PSEBR_m1616 [Pseudomonas brassicacearum subsp. brassicacearum NFM421]|uniref:Uncharacterized protein n=1 Tax=Pseudomonas brassicacearum (strain NFM421) TaxID=994484 RepID=F2KM79_PSEBN|nr:Hypothetical protein PSEBR_m1616 [Pseudomonas brassicacearum subsp. brassicacearum NFM421]